MPKIGTDIKNILFANLPPYLTSLFSLVKYLIDLLFIIASYWLAYYIRFEGTIMPIELVLFKKTLPIFIIGFLACDILFGLARGIWRYASLRDIEKILTFVFAGNGMSIMLGFIVLHDAMLRVPRSIYIINSLFIFLSISGVRLFYRILFDRLRRIKKERESVLIIGDRDMAASLQYTILRDYSHQFRISGFVTFDKDRVGNTINAIPILGMLEDAPYLVRKNKIKYIFIAVDAASNEEMKRIIRLSQQTGATVRIMPTMVDVVNGRFSLRDLRELRFEDYLERKPVEFDMERIKDDFYQKIVLVTGGGGSIGSTICRELIRFMPAKLIVVDISEDNLFRVSSVLSDISREEGLEVEVICKLADILDRIYLERIFETYNIDCVIHAAARKHVALSEINPLEAIATNVCGTLNLLTIASRFPVKNFLYISSDKAVEPVSVMGATKRLGELLVKFLSKDKSLSQKFISVRFGNVIGSSGNVVEIFTRQLQKNEPLTITDQHMERYFMSIDEATKLILQAISVGKGGETFVLDMGKPVKIVDLAHDIALFYGRQLKEEDFLFIGRRRGEKISEKLFSEKEKIAQTVFPKILRVEEEIDTQGLLDKVGQLCDYVYRNETEAAKAMLFSLVK